MKHFCKKIAAFLFLLAGIMPVTFTLFFLFKQQMIRHKMKEKLELEMLHTIVVPEAEVKWVKYKKEIQVNDKMFDVKSFTLKEGQYIFEGLYDEEETALNSYFEKSTDQKNEREFQMLSELFKILQSIYPGDADQTVITANISNVYSPLILQHISSPFISILTPPPQQAS
ncbi:MAG TPA: hypothetical protein VFH08_14585 [Chitinophagaceae bacterium]|nr:hypothetical protein [Chitinophagaceae bacterium]